VFLTKCSHKKSVYLQCLENSSWLAFYDWFLKFVFLPFFGSFLKTKHVFCFCWNSRFYSKTKKLKFQHYFFEIPGRKKIKFTFKMFGAPGNQTIYIILTLPPSFSLFSTICMSADTLAKKLLLMVLISQPIEILYNL